MGVKRDLLWKTTAPSQISVYTGQMHGPSTSRNETGQWHKCTLQKMHSCKCTPEKNFAGKKWSHYGALTTGTNYSIARCTQKPLNTEEPKPVRMQLKMELINEWVNEQTNERINESIDHQSTPCDRSLGVHENAGKSRAPDDRTLSEWTESWTSSCQDLDTHETNNSCYNVPLHVWEIGLNCCCRTAAVEQSLSRTTTNWPLLGQVRRELKTHSFCWWRRSSSFYAVGSHKKQTF